MKSASGKALLSGASGYIGGRLARRLLDEGWPVAAVVRDPARLDPLLRNRCTLIHYDGTIDSLLPAMESFGATHAFHLAAYMAAAHEPDSVTPMLQANLLFATHLVEACARTGTKRFINTGTHWQHRGGTDAYQPVWLYAATKQAFQDLLDYYGDAHGMGIVTLKLVDTYGPDDHRRKIVDLLVDAALSGQPLEASPGEQQIDLVHVDDVVEAYRQAAALLQNPEFCADHHVYAVRSGKPLTLRELARRVEAVFQRPVHVHWGARPYRSREVMNAWQAGVLLPGWQARITLEAGLSQLQGRLPA